MTSSSYGDGSWQLTVTIVELNVDRTLRVKGDLHIGGLMLAIVNGLGNTFTYLLTCTSEG